MCQDKVGWDDPLPDDLKQHWEVWLQDLHDLSLVEIPWCYTPLIVKEVKQNELHHFSDASVSGYGVCSYLRAVSTSGEVYCGRVMGKARVAPTKITTIPKRELSAAVVATRISGLLKREMEMEDVQEYFWTDSKVKLIMMEGDSMCLWPIGSSKSSQARSQVSGTMLLQ